MKILRQAQDQEKILRQQDIPFIVELGSKSKESIGQNEDRKAKDGFD